jgi:hypothetical protein
MIVKKGSRWWTSEGKKFVVIDEVIIEGVVWVHYRDGFGDPPKEYSCYRESFLQRFSPLPD